MKGNNLYKLLYEVDNRIQLVAYMLGDSVQYVTNRFEETKLKDFKLLDVKYLGRCFYD